jgi:hypothetical protein
MSNDPIHVGQLISNLGVKGLLMVVVIRESRIDLTQCQMGVLSLDFLRIPVVGKTVESDLHDFGAGTFDEPLTSRGNLNVRI